MSTDAVSAVDHPEHYGGADNAYEAIKVIEARLVDKGWLSRNRFGEIYITARGARAMGFEK